MGDVAGKMILSIVFVCLGVCVHEVHYGGTMVVYDLFDERLIAVNNVCAAPLDACLLIGAEHSQPCMA